MSLFAMPIVMANLGAEMVYILEQRLKAQQIPDEKGNKVLNDVVLTMFNHNFYTEVFRPQEAYNIGSTRQVFDRLAHSSIMRLSTASMDKLYDLMLMGLKYQLLCCRQPKDILQITLTHLQNVKAIVKDAATQAQVEDVIQKVTSLYSGFTRQSWCQLRATLARFLKDKRVKVSLFLQEGIQGADGKILLPLPLPQNPNDPQPGTVKLYNPSGSPVATNSIRLASVEVDTSDFHCHPHPLGANLYDKSRAPFVPPTRKGSAAGAKSDTSAQVPVTMGAVRTADSAPAPQQNIKGTAESMMAAGLSKAGKEELNALAQLIIPRQAENDNFKLNLFPAEDTEAPATIDVSPAYDPKVSTVNIGSTSGGKQGLEKRMADLGLGGAAEDGQDDDLLDLMDRAG